MRIADVMTRDLPTVEPGSSVRDAAREMKRRGVREAYGFVNGGQVEGDPQHAAILKMWHQAGLGLGNHTFSHPNLNVACLIFGQLIFGRRCSPTRDDFRGLCPAQKGFRL